ncbi:MAG: hypothetical protein NTV69_14360 [Caldilinea sp.]|nr:hypothetical protein [Caldilinea sp.]
MQRWGVGAVILWGIAIWQLGGRLSDDAVGMALGIVLGVLASIPASLLILAGSQRQIAQQETRSLRAVQEAPAAYPPPVIVLAGQPQLPSAGFHPQQPNIEDSWSTPRLGARRFKIVGEQEQWIE